MEKFADKCIKGNASKITKEQYLILMESLGQAPDPKFFPVELDDFPPIIRTSVTIYNNLIDHYIPGELPIFIGKDKSALPVLFDIYNITSAAEKELVLNVINIFDTKAVEAARKRIEKSSKSRRSGSQLPKPHSRSSVG